MSDAKQKYSDSADKTLVDSVEEYKFEPIKGYPMLNWRGKRPFTSTRYYPAQLKEIHGPEVEGWRNKIYYGDNLQVMSHMLKYFRGKIKLIYIDPPFDSKAEYKKKVIFGKGFIENDTSFLESKQYTDIWVNDEYLQYMFERLILMKELLTVDGSIYFHCDWHKVHHIRCIMDEIFGHGASQNDSVAGFRNEVIWCYSGGGIPSSEMPRKHDDLLWYSKSTEWIFNTQYREYSEGTIQRGRTAVKGEGAKLREEGTPVNDWWSDIKKITSPTDPEKLYYPTQKSEELLTRIILQHSNPGDLIFDGFMGSGTTQAVAMKHGRRFIGADINLGAVQITTKRLLDVAQEVESVDNQDKLITEIDNQQVEYFTGFEVLNVNDYDIFRNPTEARELLLDVLEVNKLAPGNFYDGEKDGRMVKILPINRIATRADLSELIAGFDYKGFEKRRSANPAEPVEKITLVCMGHEPDLKASFEKEAEPYKLDIEVVDILRDHQELQFKKDSEARIVIKGGYLTIERFYPMNLLGKLSLQKEKVKDWKELVESVMIDWNYDGAVLQPSTVDIPGKDQQIKGRYPIPDGAGTILIKITDLLSESLEVEAANA
jgi:DNA modification methylase